MLCWTFSRRGKSLRAKLFLLMPFRFHFHSASHSDRGVTFYWASWAGSQDNNELSAAAPHTTQHTKECAAFLAFFSLFVLLFVFVNNIKNYFSDSLIPWMLVAPFFRWFDVFLFWRMIIIIIATTRQHFLDKSLNIFAVHFGAGLINIIVLYHII